MNINWHIINWDILGNIGDLVGGIATLLALGTIVYVLQQTREMSKQNRIGAKSALISVYKEISSVMLEIDKMFLEYPDLRKYFYDGAVLRKKTRKYNQALSIAEWFLDFMDMFVVMGKAAPEHPGVSLPWQDWNVFFREIYSTSPIIREYWAAHCNWYNETLAQIFEDLPNEYIGDIDA